MSPNENVIKTPSLKSFDGGGDVTPESSSLLSNKFLSIKNTGKQQFIMNIKEFNNNNND